LEGVKIGFKALFSIFMGPKFQKELYTWETHFTSPYASPVSMKRLSKKVWKSIFPFFGVTKKIALIIWNVEENGSE